MIAGVVQENVMGYSICVAARYFTMVIVVFDYVFVAMLSPAATRRVLSHYDPFNEVKLTRTTSRMAIPLVVAAPIALSHGLARRTWARVPESRLALGSPGRECQGDIIKIFQ